MWFFLCGMFFLLIFLTIKVYYYYHLIKNTFSNYPVPLPCFNVLYFCLFVVFAYLFFLTDVFSFVCLLVYCLSSPSSSPHHTDEHREVARYKEKSTHFGVRFGFKVWLHFLCMYRLFLWASVFSSESEYSTHFIETLWGLNKINVCREQAPPLACSRYPPTSLLGDFLWPKPFTDALLGPLASPLRQLKYYSPSQPCLSLSVLNVHSSSSLHQPCFPSPLIFSQ